MSIILVNRDGNISLDNYNDVAYISGDEFTDDSVRLLYGTIDADVIVQHRTNGEWLSASLSVGGNSLYVGKNLHLQDVGGYLTCTDTSRDMRRETVVHEYDNTGSISQITDYVYSPIETAYVMQPDESGEFVGTEYTISEVITISALRSKYYFKMGNTLPTSNLVMEIFYGADDTGHVMATQIVDYTTLIANTEFAVSLDNSDAVLSFAEGETITVKISCANTFSVKADATNVYIWHNGDIQRWIPKRISRENVIFTSNNYTVYNNEFVAVDTTGGEVTVTAVIVPAPDIGYYFSINDVENSFAVNKCTVSFAGSKLDGVVDGTIDLTYNGGIWKFIYEGVTTGWRIVSTNPISELAEMYEHDNATPIDIETVNLWVTSKNMTEGYSRALIFHNDAGDTYFSLPAGQAYNGYYWLTWTVSAVGYQGDTYEFGIMVNSTVSNKTVAQSQQGIQGTISLSGTALVNLTNLDEIRGAARNITGIHDITVVHSNISIVKI